MSDKTTCYWKNRVIILNRGKECYENNKERLRKQAWNKYRELFEKRKDIKGEYRGKKYKNMPVWRKQTKTKRIQKKICKAKNKHKNFCLYLHSIKWTKNP